MGFFKSASEANTGSGSNSAIINNKYGEFLARIESFKVSESSKGIFAIATYTPIQVIESEEIGGIPSFVEGSPVHTMMKHDANHSMMEQYMSQHIAPCIGKEPTHRFSEVDSENDAEWEKLWEEGFGKRKINADETGFEWVGDNPWKGGLLRIKSIRDYQEGRKEDKKKKDAEGKVKVFTKVLVLEAPDLADLSDECVAKYGKTFHPAYQAGLVAAGRLEA